MLQLQEALLTMTLFVGPESCAAEAIMLWWLSIESTRMLRKQLHPSCVATVCDKIKFQLIRPYMCRMIAACLRSCLMT